MAFRSTEDSRHEARPRRRDDDAGARRRAPRMEGVKEIDINDAEFLRQFVTDHGKILPARLTGIPVKMQRQVRHGVRRCRVMGLLP